MHIVQILSGLVEHHVMLVYALIFIGIIFEGELIILCTGILLHLGALNVFITFPFVLVAGLLKTFLGYYVGSLIRKKWQKTKFLKHVEKHVNNMMPHFQKKPFWSIFISKFILINHAVIIYAGYRSIDLKKYLQAEITATLIWAPGLLTMGYFFSYTAIRISHSIWEFSLIVLVLIALFIILDKIVGWFYELFEEFYDTE